MQHLLLWECRAAEWEWIINLKNKNEKDPHVNVGIFFCL